LPTSPVELTYARARPTFGQINRPSARVDDRPSELSRNTIYLRENFAWLPVIVVSGNPIPKDYTHASAFFRKPYEFDGVAARIKALLPTNQSVPAAKKKADRQ
jgi:hypothetical protein